MTYVYTGPSTLATIGIAVIASVVTAAVLYGLWWLEGWWADYRAEPGPVEEPVDGVPIEHDDPPFPDGWHWTPSQEEVTTIEMRRALLSERFGGGR